MGLLNEVDFPHHINDNTFKANETPAGVSFATYRFIKW